MKRILLSMMVLAFAMVGLQGQPRLAKQGSATQLVVDGKPMLIIGGELGNSSATTLVDCRQHFPKLRAMGLNTVLAPAYWELIEPAEGEFDLTTVQNVIDEARNNDLKVVFLWFGAWKNSMSCYAPEWFKRDTKRFPRVHLQDGTPMEEASSLSRNVLDADSRAFCRLMTFIRDYDSAQHTVIMVQVENEIGMINEPRDYSKDATRLYESAVPKRLVDYLNSNYATLHPYMASRFHPENGKTWAKMFGNDIYAEEIFQAWTYAEYVEQLAAAGKKIYNIPMYINVALDSRGRQPGQYPSAGPLAQLIDIWHCGAPSIDMLGLDLYDKGFRDWTAKYHLHNNLLFIPEIRLEDQDGVRALYAFGHHDALGFCPFSIEDYDLRTTAIQAPTLTKEDLAKDDQLNMFPSTSMSQAPIVASYSLLRQLEPLILAKQGSDDLFGVHLDNALRETSLITPDGITLTVKHSYTLGWEPGSKESDWPEVGCLIIRLGPEDYLVAGSGVVITFGSSSASALASTRAKVALKDGSRVGLAKCELVAFPQPVAAAQPATEASPKHSAATSASASAAASSSAAAPAAEPVILRHLSGDQTHQGRHVRIPVGSWQIQHFRLYRY